MNPKPKRNTELAFEAIGTQWTITLYGRETVPKSLLDSITTRIDQFDKDYSRFRADSLIIQMSKQAGEYELPADAKIMFDLYRELYELTDGAMTPLIGQTLADAGYDATYSLQSKSLVQPPSWETVMHYDFPRLTVDKPTLLDVGAIGKGYLVDIISELLESQGISEYCVDGSGDMRQRRSGQALTIGLENPLDEKQAIGTVQLMDKSLCGSAGNRRKWAGYNHIINPKSLTSPDGILAVWVVAATTALADGLTTALYFVQAKRLQAQYTFEYALLHSDLSIEYSYQFPGIFFRDEG